MDSYLRVLYLKKNIGSIRTRKGKNGFLFCFNSFFKFQYLENFGGFKVEVIDEG